MSIENEYDDAFWRAGIARRCLAVIDEALYSLKLQRKALEAEVHAKEHTFADFIVAHKDEVREITKRRGEERRVKIAADEAAIAASPSGLTLGTEESRRAG